MWISYRYIFDDDESEIAYSALGVADEVFAYDATVSKTPELASLGAYLAPSVYADPDVLDRWFCAELSEPMERIESVASEEISWAFTDRHKLDAE